jgi:hypothetical protein
MSPLLIGSSAVVSLLLLVSLALVMMRKARNARDGVQRPMGDRAVLATITDVQIRQDWKEREQWERSPWDGRLVKQKTWRTYYEVTAQWLHPQTKQSCTFRSKFWFDEIAKTPTVGGAMTIIVDLRHP